MAKIRTELFKPLPENVYDRLKLYRENAKKNHLIEVNQFISLINKGVYPVKCLNCFRMGFSWCRWWLMDFKCTEDKSEVINKIEKLL